MFDNLKEYEKGRYRYFAKEFYIPVFIFSIPVFLYAILILTHGGFKEFFIKDLMWTNLIYSIVAFLITLFTFLISSAHIKINEDHISIRKIKKKEINFNEIIKIEETDNYKNQYIEALIIYYRYKNKIYHNESNEKLVITNSIHGYEFLKERLFEKYYKIKVK